MPQPNFPVQVAETGLKENYSAARSLHFFDYRPEQLPGFGASALALWAESNLSSQSTGKAFFERENTKVWYAKASTPLESTTNCCNGSPAPSTK